MTSNKNPAPGDTDPGKASTRMKPFALLLLLVFPALTVYFGCALRAASGPYWLSDNLDPSYAYLLNSLNIANLRRPYFIGHPGTPVHVVGAGVIRVMNLGSNRAETTRKVLANPEHYITAINNVLVVFCGFCVLITGYIAMLVTRGLPKALLVQATPFVSTTTLAGLTGARPEPLMIALATLVVGVTLLTLKFDKRKHALLYAVVFAVLIGAGLAAKVNFVPVALVPLIVLPSWKSRLAFGVATAIAFAVAILPILEPTLVRETFEFMFNLATHTGRYGSGQAGFIDPSRYVSAAIKLVSDDALFFIFMAIGGVVLALKSRFQSLGGAKRRILIAVAAAQLLQLLMVAKHPNSRYLIPSLALVGLNLVLLADAFAEKMPDALRYVPSLVIGLTIIGVQVWTSATLFKEARNDRQFQSEAYAAVNKQFPNVPVVTYYTASSPSYALEFGSGYSGNLFSAELQRLYPNQFFYNPWTKKLTDFAGPVTLDQVRGTSDWFVLRGCSLSDPDFKAFLTAPPLPDNVSIEPISGTDVDHPGLIDCDAVYKATVKPAP